MLSSEVCSRATLDVAFAAGSLYALLDACDAPSVPLLCQALGEASAVSLYRGSAEEQYADVAPYLLHIEQQDVFDWTLAFSAAPGWGMFVVAPQPLDVIRTHFRKFLTVLDPNGKRLYFRFYDPRVLPLFLTTCDDGQIEALFGPTQRFVLWHGGAEGRELRRTGARPPRVVISSRK